MPGRESVVGPGAVQAEHPQEGSLAPPCTTLGYSVTVGGGGGGGGTTVGPQHRPPYRVILLEGFGGVMS